MENEDTINVEELAEAFKPEAKRTENKKIDNPKKTKNKKKVASISVFCIGIITLIVGVVFLVLALTKGASVQDGEYLVSAENWVLEDADGVIWDFTEVGKGTLTTNNHLNDYDFIWAIKDGKLLIETDWLYDLNNEYEYALDQGAGVLTLTDNGETHVFKRVSE